jgi:hypothetical protein
MDPFDQMSDRQVTWLEILSTFIILAFILGSFAFVGQFAGSPQRVQRSLMSGSQGAVYDGALLSGSEAPVFNGPLTVPGAANAEQDDLERRAMDPR